MDKSKHTELRECPFCGNEPDFHFSEELKTWFIKCSFTGDNRHEVTVLDEKQELAIEEWNSRSDKACNNHAKLVDVIRRINAVARDCSLDNMDVINLIISISEKALSDLNEIDAGVK